MIHVVYAPSMVTPSTVMLCSLAVEPLNLSPYTKRPLLLHHQQPPHTSGDGVRKKDSPMVVEGSSVCLVVDGNGRVDARLVGVEINEIIDVVANVALGEGASGEAGGRRGRERKDRRTYGSKNQKAAKGAEAGKHGLEGERARRTRLRGEACLREDFISLHVLCEALPAELRVAAAFWHSYQSSPKTGAGAKR